jgi:post-segregation antitoxin (ccd killing protein)
MSTYEKVTVSLPAELLQAAREASAGNLSAYTARAIRAQAVRDAAEQLAAWRQSTGDALDDVFDMAEEDER